MSGSGTYAHGATATIQATANTGYHFVKWNDNVTDNPRTVTVTQDTALVATFEVGNSIVETNGNADSSPTPFLTDSLPFPTDKARQRFTPCRVFRLAVTV